MPNVQDTTQVLLDLQKGDEAAAAKLLPLVYDELRGLARHHMRRERPSHTLQATAVVHEAYLRLVEQTKVDWKGKTHFFAVSAEMIRRILVDHARKHAAAKRGGERVRVTVNEADAVSGTAANIDLIALDDALQELSRLSERQGRVIELRFFAGLSVEETAYILGVSQRTVKEEWRVARAWLAHRMNQ